MNVIYTASRLPVHLNLSGIMPPHTYFFLHTMICLVASAISSGCSESRPSSMHIFRFFRCFSIFSLFLIILVFFFSFPRCFFRILHFSVFLEKHIRNVALISRPTLPTSLGALVACSSTPFFVVVVVVVVVILIFFDYFSTWNVCDGVRRRLTHVRNVGIVCARTHHSIGRVSST